MIRERTLLLTRCLIARVMHKARCAFYLLLSNNHIVGKPKCFQPIQAVGSGTIVCEEGVVIGYFPSPYCYSTYAYLEARNPLLSIKIGRNTVINNNVSIISENAGIRIGCDCLIGVNVEIIDSDFHALILEDRLAGKLPISKPVCIGDIVFIGSNVKIMKGVTIGDGSVIGNGSVVTKDIPSNVVAAGNPAVPIKELI